MRNTKSLLAIFLACMMVISCFVVTPVMAEDTGVWDEWDGTSADDGWKTKGDDGFYHITSAEQLANFAADINSHSAENSRYYQDETVVLDVNVRLNSEADIANFASWSEVAPALAWTPIGNYNGSNSYSFAGTFDGQGHTIEGMYIPTQTERSAFFGALAECAAVKNLTFSKAHVTGKGNGVSVVIAQAVNTHSDRTNYPATNVTVRDSYLKSTASGGTGVIYGRTAGLVNQILVFDNCDVYNTTIEGPGYVGGIFGFHGSGDLGGLTFQNCDLSGNTINVTNSSGGILGGVYTLSGKYAQTITFDTCTVDQNFNATSNNNGGLFGYANSPITKMIIKNCSVAGDIHTLQNSGIFVGRYGTGAVQKDVEIEVTNCVSTANLYSDVGVEGTNGQCNGLVIGLFQANGDTSIKSIKVDGLTASGTIDLTAQTGGTAGIFGNIGPAVGTIDVKNVNSTMTIKATDTVGGLFARLPAATSVSVSDVKIGGDISSSTGNNVGGLFGYNAGAITTLTVDNTLVSANVTSAGKNAGGIIGLVGTSAISSIEISNTLVTGNIETKNGEGAGGFIGSFNHATPVISFDSCAFTGNVTGSANRVGGFVGNISYNTGTQVASFNNCYVNANIKGGNQVGGLVGNISNEYAGLSVTNALVYGTLTATGTDAGALVGSYGTDDTYYNDAANEVTVDGFYYDMAFTGVSPRLGTFRGWNDCKIYEGEDVDTDAFTTCVFYTPNADVTSTEIGSSATPNSITKSGDTNEELILAVQQALGTLPEKLFAADVWDGSIADGFESGTGLETDPYVIKTAAQLAYFAQQVNAKNTNVTSAHVVLGASIQLNSDEDLANYASWNTDNAPALGWTPIGYYADGVGLFTGTFDGKGYTISGMYIDDSTGSQFDGRASLFGYANTNTVVKNLTITKSYVNAKTCTAILYAFTSGFPANTTNVDIVDCTVVGGTDGTGLLMGKTGGPGTVTISDCDLSGNITCGFNGAGFVGFISGTGTMTEINVINCSTNVDITRTNTSDGGSGVGAIFGTLANTSGSPIINAINIKNTDGVKREYKVSATGYRTFGGLIGLLTATTLGDVTIDGINVVADIDCTACPTSVNASDIGAVIGYIRADSHTGTIAFKNMSVSGYTTGGQNSGILIGRINTRSAATTDIQTIVVDNVDSNVVFEGLKAAGNSQCIGGVVGLSQKPITTLTVTDFNTNNTYRAANTDANSAPSDCGGIVGSATIITANISDSVFNDTINGRSGLGGMFGTGTITTANISDCKVTSTITGTDGVAGIVGIFKGETINVTNTIVESTLTGGQYVAGFVGDVQTNANTYPKCYFTFEGCAFTGSASASSRIAGGFIGDYDTGSGTAVAGTTNNCGIFTFKNCFVDADITSASNVGGLIGRIYPPNGKLVVENVVLLGDRTGSSAGALIGTYGGANSLADLATINNLYFNNGSVASLFGATGGTVNYASNVFYTPADVDGKQANIAVLGFVEAMKTITNTDGSTPAWMNMAHTCESAEFAEGNVYGDVADTFVLTCQKPGCAHHKVENLGAKFGASIRTIEPYGLRFGFRFNSDLVEGEGEDINVGILLIPADLITGELTVDTAKVQNVKAAKSFQEGSQYYADGAYNFAGVLTGIPSGSFDRPITARAYIVVDGITYYTETATTTYRTIADLAGVTIAE